MNIDYNILEKQHAELSFKNGKVTYFSISTQYDTADTIEDAIKNIVAANEKYDEKSALRYIIENKYLR